MKRIGHLFLRKKCHQLELGLLEDTWCCLFPLFIFQEQLCSSLVKSKGKQSIYSKPILFLITLIQPILSPSFENLKAL